MSITSYFEGVKNEVTHITWPSTRLVVIMTIVVIIVSAVVGYYMGAFDILFQKLLALIITQ